MKFDSTFVRSESASKLQSRGRRLFRTVFVTLALVVLLAPRLLAFYLGDGTLLYKTSAWTQLTSIIHDTF